LVGLPAGLPAAERLCACGGGLITQERDGYLALPVDGPRMTRISRMNADAQRDLAALRCTELCALRSTNGSDGRSGQRRNCGSEKNSNMLLVGATSSPLGGL